MNTKFIEGIIGESYKAKIQRIGELLVEVNTLHWARNLLSQTRIADLDTTVTPYRSLNSSQDVISDPDLMNETKTDLLEGPASQGLISATRITILREDKEILTKNLILTFDRSTLPEFINAGYI